MLFLIFINNSKKIYCKIVSKCETIFSGPIKKHNSVLLKMVLDNIFVKDTVAIPNGSMLLE